MTYPETLPDSAAQNDPGHVTDHNLLTTAVGNIDGRLRTVELAGSGLTLEQIQDAVATMIVAGSNVTASYNDTAGTLTLTASATGGGLTLEQVQDAVAAMLVAGANITVAYDDTAGTLLLSSSGGALAPPTWSSQPYFTAGMTVTPVTNPVTSQIEDAIAPVSPYNGVGGLDNSLVHPSLIFVDEGWNGYRYWLCATPYPNSNSDYENPCIWASNDCTTWVVPSGTTNPIFPKPTSGYNSDVQLVYGNDGYLYLFWRQVNYLDYGANDEITLYSRSLNGTSWSSPVAIIQASGSTHIYASPCAVQEPNGSWKLWAVDVVPDQNEIVMFTAPSISGTWTKYTGTLTGLSQASDRDWWHFDIKRVGGEYVMVVSDTSRGSSWSGALYRAVSRDGISWVRDSAAFTSIGSYYRSTFVPAKVKGKDGYELIYGRTGPWRFTHGFAYLQ